MTSRRSVALAALVLFAVTGCDFSSPTTGVGGNADDALLRILNSTSTTLDLTSGGQVVGGSGHVTAGTTSDCIRVDPAGPALGLREAGAVSDLGSFAPTITARTSYTVLAYISDVGSLQTLTLVDAFIPTSGLSGLRIVDVAPGLGSLDVYITPRNGPLDVPSTASIGYGSNTGFFDVNPGINQVRFTTATTSTIVFDAGTINLLPGQLATLVLSQPGGAAATPVATLIPAC
ncbi:MAG TPA: DUF4397 domain-containing protein [Gemmatimonadaceae bacterium]|nr:DUF4397 domain-containing protein [Gemmatimonadaceae bacterium]